jgi:hypothetical protein
MSGQWIINSLEINGTMKCAVQIENILNGCLILRGQSTTPLQRYRAKASTLYPCPAIIEATSENLFSKTGGIGGDYA